MYWDSGCSQWPSYSRMPRRRVREKTQNSTYFKPQHYMEDRGRLHASVALTSDKILFVIFGTIFLLRWPRWNTQQRQCYTKSCRADSSQEENVGNLNFVSHVARWFSLTVHNGTGTQTWYLNLSIFMCLGPTMLFRMTVFDIGKFYKKVKLSL
jgi:hypothetical protein